MQTGRENSDHTLVSRRTGGGVTRYQNPVLRVSWVRF